MLNLALWFRMSFKGILFSFYSIEVSMRNISVKLFFIWPSGSGPGADVV